MNVDADFCLCITEAVSFLLLHVKCMNVVLKGVEGSLRQQNLGDE